jgi:hypothetical protein
VVSTAQRAERDDAVPRDLGTFNRWLNVSRIRACIGVAVAVCVLETMHRGTFDIAALLAICSLSILVSVIGLRSRTLARWPGVSSRRRRRST